MGLAHPRNCFGERKRPPEDLVGAGVGRAATGRAFVEGEVALGQDFGGGCRQGPLASLGHGNKWPRLGGSKQQTFIPSGTWRPEGGNQGVGRAVLSWRPLPAPPGLWGPVSGGLWLHASISAPSSSGCHPVCLQPSSPFLWGPHHGSRAPVIQGDLDLSAWYFRVGPHAQVPGVRMQAELVEPSTALGPSQAVNAILFSAPAL